MVYRPTVRYHSTFKKYVDELFQATHLDRNQIVRAALFAAAHSKEFQSILHSNKKKDVPLPRPNWSMNQAVLWREQNPDIKEKEGDVSAYNRRETSTEELVGTSGQRRREDKQTRCQQSIPRQEREVRGRVRTSGGGLTIQLRP
ncbi:hypothetical protein [Pseudobacillus wudalianchiensis]|uniref:Uncharacterized protein n=1 Tax=Pseudobacillus wudalianchiensis TaxID=1743143 RepID=A0A1B9AU42_9BACI|nr:hypothetical protein [Bacillus wudalianchiensis]OCA87271.1 hypothetical protein A8F95_08455 [Bacillus wudalianchiensis]